MQMIVRIDEAGSAARKFGREPRISLADRVPAQAFDGKSCRSVIAGAIGMLLACQLAFCWASHMRSLEGSVDMRAFYAAGRIVTSSHGSSLYRVAWQQHVQAGIFPTSGRMLPFLYPAYSALFFVPLSLMPYKFAFGTFWLVNAGLLALVPMLLRYHLTGLRRLPLLLVLCGFACLFPVSIAWTQGQISFLLLLFYSLSYLLLEKQRPFLAGVAAALALAKFQTALPVALLFLCWRVHRFVAGFVCGALLLGAVSVVITGPSGALEYVSGLSQVAATTLFHATAAKQQYGMYAGDMPNLHGFFFALTHGNLAGQAAAAICSISAMVWAYSKAPSLPLALVTAMLVSYHLEPYDLMLLLLPIAVALNGLIENRSRCGDLRLKQAVVLSLSAAFLIAPIAPLLLVWRMSFLFTLPVLGVLWTVASLECQTPLGTDGTTPTGAAGIVAGAKQEAYGGCGL